MMGQDTLNQIKALEKMYLENWGKEVDYTVLPVSLTQENLVKVLERIVETGESILVGFNKIKK